MNYLLKNVTQKANFPFVFFTNKERDKELVFCLC